MTGQVLLIEDDDAVRTALAQTIELHDLVPLPMSGFVQARRNIRASFPGVILSDIRMPHQDGFNVLSFAMNADPELPVILMTGHSDVPTAMKALRDGAYDYLEKPCGAEKLIEVLKRALGHRRLVMKSRKAERALLRNDAAAVNFPGGGEVSTGFRRMLRHAAGSGRHIHLCGPPGSGKRQAAHVINRISPVQHPFLAINFAHAPATAVTGLDIPEGAADLSCKNIESATPAQVQELETLVRACPQMRLITTSTLPLARLEGGHLPPALSDAPEGARPVEVHIPGLDERREDLPEIFESLLRQTARSLDTDMPEITNDILSDLLTRQWPGNIPELRAYTMTVALGTQIRAQAGAPKTLGEQMDAFERLVLIATLKRTGGRVTEAAELLAVPRNTFYDRLARHDLSARDYR